MPERYDVICEDDVSERIRNLAFEYDLTEEDVVKQLIERGLEQLDQ